MVIQWAPLVLGIVAIVGGVLILRSRVWVAGTIANLQRATFGRAGARLASQSTPGGLIAPSLITIAIGVTLVLLALFYGSAL